MVTHMQLFRAWCIYCSYKLFIWRFWQPCEFHRWFRQWPINYSWQSILLERVYKLAQTIFIYVLLGIKITSNPQFFNQFGNIELLEYGSQYPRLIMKCYVVTRLCTIYKIFWRHNLKMHEHLKIVFIYFIK